MQDKDRLDDEKFSEALEEKIADEMFAEATQKLYEQRVALAELAGRFNAGFSEIVAALAALPASREKSLALTNLETGVLWADRAFMAERTAIDKNRAPSDQGTI